MSAKLFIWVQDGTVQIWIKRIIWGVPRKFFCEGLRVQLAMKLFCLENFMVYGILVPISLYPPNGRNKDQKLVSHFFENRIFCRVLIVVSLKVYSKFGWSTNCLNWPEYGQWPTVISNTPHSLSFYISKILKEILHTTNN